MVFGATHYALNKYILLSIGFACLTSALENSLRGPALVAPLEKSLWYCIFLDLSMGISRILLLVMILRFEMDLCHLPLFSRIG